MKDKKKESKAFAVAQQLGKSLFLPIAILPLAGLMLGIGSSFTNETTIATYGLQGLLHEGTVLYTILLIFKSVGSVIFDNLALIFALAVAMGMTKKEKGVAVLSAGIFYVVMLITINVFLQLSGDIVNGQVAADVKEGAISTVLGIPTLQMGVFGGIVAGMITAALCNKFYKQQLPDFLSFFSGTRFVPIISIATAILTGFILFIVWPPIQNSIFAFGKIVNLTGAFGSFIFGFIQRALCPFGLHHIFYLPFWQTGIGGTSIVDGKIVMGAQNIFFAELSSSSVKTFSSSAVYLDGSYPVMLGGLPGAALAMYFCSKEKKKKQSGALLFSAALTSFVTGITEPIEFTFLFLSPALFCIHAILEGLAYALCYLLHIYIGVTFSQGFIDFVLYGVLQGQTKTHWMYAIPLIVIYFFAYFFIFRFFILKWNLKTPGREDDGEDMKLMSKTEYEKKTGTGIFGGKNSHVNIDEKSVNILIAIGGIKNVTEIDCCATRLRLTLVDSSVVNEALLKVTGALGVVIKDNAIQVIYGPSVAIIKSNFEELINMICDGKVNEAEIMTSDARPVTDQDLDQEDKNDQYIPSLTGTSITEKKDIILGSHIKGQMLLLTEVEDEVFASLTLGDGIAIEPTEGKLYAPADGIISLVFDTEHVIGITTDDGVELLLHVGIDTVKLQGKYFEAQVKANQKVNKGDLLMIFDIDAIKSSGYKVTTLMVVCNTNDYLYMKPLATGNISPGQDLLFVKS